MPGIAVTLSGEPDADLTRQVADELAHLTVSLLDKSLETTMVQVDYLPHEQWFVAGCSLVDWGLNSFRLAVTVTDETNTREQKARYHQCVFERMEALIGDVHPHSNIHVVDCRAGAYGYGGVTQEYRYQHPSEPSR